MNNFATNTILYRVDVKHPSIIDLLLFIKIERVTIFTYDVVEII